METSREQRDIIYSEGDIVVTANPGSGKTTTLARRVIRLLKDGTSPEDILCITFTRKAKKEMFEKIRELGDREISNLTITKINIHTFHSFAYQCLEEEGPVLGDLIDETWMKFSILNKFIQDETLNYDKEYIITDFVTPTVNAIKYIKAHGIMPDEIDIKRAGTILEEIHPKKSIYTVDEMRALLASFVDNYKKYEESKSGKIDYTDVLMLFLKKFPDRRFRHVLVDEAQDMNWFQAEIVGCVGERLFLVGDRKQAIFGFQGGSIKNFEKFTKRCEPMKLSANRRSTQQILDYSKDYFLNNTKNRESFEQELEGFCSNKSGDLPTVISTSAHNATILDLLKKYPDNSIGIITHTNEQITKISQYLDANNKPHSSTSLSVSSWHTADEIQVFLEGLFSNKREEKIRAAFTSFSKYSLEEASEFSRAFQKQRYHDLGTLMSWGSGLSRNDLNDIFDEQILPICASRGATWFSTAIHIKRKISEYLNSENPTLGGVLDFIAVSKNEMSDEKNVNSNLTLTTIHKAKGQEFDIVIYIPQSEPRKYLPNIISKSIVRSYQVDVQDETEEESLHMKFVAFTRAREKLIILTKDNDVPKYHMEGLSTVETDEREKDIQTATSNDTKLTEAYSMFVAGRVDNAQKMLRDKRRWVEKYIEDYFSKMDHISYSTINNTNPRKFMLYKIIDIPKSSASRTFGDYVHKDMELTLKELSVENDDKEDVKTAVQNGLDAIEDLKKDFPGLSVQHTEKKLKIPLDMMMTNCSCRGMQFIGTPDVVFKHDGGYLIADYKTGKNRNDDNLRKHRKQLSAYRRLFSKWNHIDEKDVSTCVIYVALKGGINTGKWDRKTDMGKDVYSKFEHDLQKVLEWKNDPRKFIDELLAAGPKNRKFEDRVLDVLLEKLKPS